MTDITNEILITAAFMSVLILAWAIIWRFRPKIGGLLPQQRAITCLGGTALGNEARAFLIEAEGRKMLVVAARRGGVEIMPLPSHSESAEVAPCA